MKTQNSILKQANDAIKEAERLLAKYDQQDTTAQNCGFSSYIDMLVHFERTSIEYSILTKYAALGFILNGYTARN